MQQEAHVSPDTGQITKPKRRWLHGLVAGTIILFSGMFIGSALTMHFVSNRIANFIQQPGEFPAHIAHRMERRLDLSAVQKEQVEAILQERMHVMAGIHREFWPRMKTEIKQLRDEISAVLTPEQAEEWLTHFDKLHEKWGHAFDKGKQNLEESPSE